MRLIIHKTYEDASLWTALHIADRINAYKNGAKTPPEKPFVLGLPTGGSPRLIYREFIKMVKDKKLSFANVHTFNMDEYVGLSKDHPQSYRHFMMENLFNHVDIDLANVHIPNGMADDLLKECRLYEEAIAKVGGIELFLGGMGVDGHIAFNEPGSSLQSRTRIKTLTEETKVANARFFDGDITKVPSNAITVGVGTVMDSREVVIIVSGKSKARALRAVVEGSVNHMWTLSGLQLHRKAIIVSDEEALDELKVGTVRYFKDIEKENLKKYYDRIK
ncbi:MAG: glucosamine-6-phosphate deaminase [Treponema sp.]|jgi:glucosamine-6-phosphate deaminase|nr:glucosamine-6-phosphate deaminase [Treponema sp.]